SVLHSSSFVVKKDVFSKVGRYNTSLKTGEDTDLYVRIGLHFNVAFSSRICAQHRLLKDSLSRSGVDLSSKASFQEYEIQEVGNPALKKFLDLNRFSICVAAKLYGDKSTFQENFRKIDRSNLNGKQRFLIGLSRPALKAMIKLKSFLSSFGIRSSSFK
ncbi:MAG: glycosyltransferase family 2 protein, partial [Flavobacteriaceae bacterium]|nr:glycosyltransferase family 2 protein [Flavobacteriaceae bacterium]